ncbi:hypothetical protein [Novipirellula rosea]|uniref:hypothetical protein n=1 Tax=Novipirellula rosea TaxID=1031540 RepID=UPI0030EEA46C
MPRINNERLQALGGPRTETPLRKMDSTETSSSSGRTRQIASGSQTAIGLDVRIACREVNRFWQTWHDSELWGTDSCCGVDESSSGAASVWRSDSQWQWLQQATAAVSLE